MNTQNNNLRVAILISTKDRPDFIIRELAYYVKLQSPHPIYIADSSNDKNAETLKNAINKLSDKITIKYTWYPPGPDNTTSLLDQVKEKYACYVGDDDYQIPDSLVKCAEFLENNPDYSSAGGRSVSFRLKESGPYGELQRLADYPRYSIQSETARQRLIDFMKVIYSIIFFVHRVNTLKNSLKSKMYMSNTLNELIYWNHCAISGKSKLIDYLSLVRQIHSSQYSMANSFDWVTSKNFYDDYEFFKNDISKAIAEKDNIEIQEAEKATKEAFWGYIQKMLSSDYKYYLTEQYPHKINTKNNLKLKIGVLLPIFKYKYKACLKRFLGKNVQMHYEVLQPNSKYYKDFKPVMDSFTGSFPKNL